MKNQTSHQQAGVAIITVLLMVALTTITVVSMTTRQRLDIRRTANQQSLQQAKALAMAGEKFAVATLMRDKTNIAGSKTDSLDDDWAQSLPPVPVDQSTITGCVYDLQGKFNLNNLITVEGKVDADALKRFQRLLKDLGITVAKSAAIVDWMDKNGEVSGSEGAESDYYSALDPPYRVANQPMASVSELKMVKGFFQQDDDQAADYELLLPHITALPEYTKININTATPAVIASIDESLAEKAEDLSRWEDGLWELYPECENIFDLEQLVSKASADTHENGSDKTPYDNEKEFFDKSGITANADVKAEILKGLSVASDYYQIRIEVVTGEVTITQFSLVKRNNKGASRVLQRSRNVF